MVNGERPVRPCFCSCKKDQIVTEVSQEEQMKQVVEEGKVDEEKQEGFDCSKCEQVYQWVVRMKKFTQDQVSKEIDEDRKEGLQRLLKELETFVPPKSHEEVSRFVRGPVMSDDDKITTIPAVGQADEIDGLWPVNATPSHLAVLVDEFTQLKSLFD
ncbi:hypothetical protein Ciccas_009622 [Cichlidogyrus casuarinus]|uniref:Uncharacterized protein n=1 Tax=Cichlidogyrus casuarinus TaxID=1844966 RepID=A0ABD2PXH8_9PLAT